METEIIKIGKSRGLIIPAKYMKVLGDHKTFDVSIRDGGLFIAPSTPPRESWDALFAEAKNKGFAPDAEDMPFENEFDKHNWTW
jgi:antitoxin MazE